jgi:phosphatidylinositol-3-phosphatase
MISRLAAIRLSWSQFITVATTSALATALIISAAVGHPPVPSAVVAALRHRIVVHRTAVAQSPVAAAAAIPTASAAPTPVASSSPADSGSASDSSAGASGSSPATSDSTGSSDSTSSSTSTTSTATNPPAKPTYKVKHVFVIALSTTSYDATWGHGSVATYLNGTLRPKGTLLSGYRTLGGAELPDYLAMISGQAPNPDTRTDCSTYADFPSSAKADKAGQMSGHGCVYPSTVLTIGDQVTASGKVWKGYQDDMGSSACVHPNSGAADDVQLPGAGAEYATRHNPFIYFHSLLDLGDCSNDDVSLDRLPVDLRTVSKTPTYSFISPGVCDDASDLSCPAGRPGGLAGEDAFLKLWVPRILSSEAYKRDGALIIVFAATPTPAPASTSTTTTSTTPASTTTTSTTSTSTTSTSTTSTTATTITSTTSSVPASGDSGPLRTGALIVSQYAARGKTLSTPYGPYSLLRSLEDLFGYTPLVNAAKAKSFVKSALPDA